jgi:hypothetical protein
MMRGIQGCENGTESGAEIRDLGEIDDERVPKGGKYLGFRNDGGRCHASEDSRRRVVGSPVGRMKRSFDVLVYGLVIAHQRRKCGPWDMRLRSIVRQMSVVRPGGGEPMARSARNGNPLVVSCNLWLYLFLRRLVCFARHGRGWVQILLQEGTWRRIKTACMIFIKARG